MAIIPRKEPLLFGVFFLTKNNLFYMDLAHFINDM